MGTAIQVIWWIGLLGSVIGTIVIVKQLLLIVDVIADIRKLTRLTREAADGAQANLEGIAALEPAGPPGRRLVDAAETLKENASSIDRRLAALVPGAGARSE